MNGRQVISALALVTELVDYHHKPTRPSMRAQGGCVIERIVSGGQTGVDRAALDFAIRHGIPHGGWCPSGRRAENGAIETCYELKETPDTNYAERTEWNVRDSDGTLIISVSSKLTGGSALTRDLAIEYGRPWLHVSNSRDSKHAAEELREFVRQFGIKVLNVAGPRLSTEPAAQPFASEVLQGLLLAKSAKRE